MVGGIAAYSRIRNGNGGDDDEFYDVEFTYVVGGSYDFHECRRKEYYYHKY